MPLPRCGHEHTVPCAKAVQLEQWTGVQCEEQDVVCEGVVYGPKDFNACRKKVTFRRRCGHESSMPCEEAFRMAESGPPLCTEQVIAKSPHCGHDCKISCHELPNLSNI
eukprot:CAMPEP_0172631642 /NCGR_PEP_ID=MMETSP1068-20121228/180419_1 /TAXON_ID=35684 /ORGANISM="Pseudopedinella elastica, Strain CCMP716" /LENGTH=108 /DNA_ID=CAMNT_0013442843 /DNA_START=10 /DNA_END=333 /DNA_ORIENTATION=-